MSNEKICDENVECLPIKSLDELKNWKSCNSEKHSSCPLLKRSSEKESPKTLVCHDMKGGYLEDRFHNGSETEDNYYFVHWSMVDIFVYFSHYFVTIPPCSWIAAAHCNGVKVLGTLITEWDAGKEICDNFLCNKESVHQISKQLVDIAAFYKFDGWLINIENKLTANQVPLLEEFVKFLTSKMHESQPDSLVIWYDSIIQTGELKWQNELNENNRNFFQACDGIFLNYNWKKENLKKSVDEAGSRKTDVFVGVDVFGRGCLGGGGFSTDIAVTAARDFNLSVAIFAPGWVHECLDQKDFKENQYKYWNSLAELCSTRAIDYLPYSTSFCPGFGKKMYKDGKIISCKPWYNMSLQQPQPSFHYTNCCSWDSVVTLHSEDAFNGGGCLELKAKVTEGNTLAIFKILSTSFLIKTDCFISYTFKSVDKNEIYLVFNCHNNDNSSALCFVNESKEDGNTQNSFDESTKLSSKTVLPTSVKSVMGSVENVPWIKREYKLCCLGDDDESYFVNEVNIAVKLKETSSTEVTVLLGELSRMPKRKLKEPDSEENTPMTKKQKCTELKVTETNLQECRKLALESLEQIALDFDVGVAVWLHELKPISNEIVQFLTLSNGHIVSRCFKFNSRKRLVGIIYLLNNKENAVEFCTTLPNTMSPHGNYPFRAEHMGDYLRSVAEIEDNLMCKQNSSLKANTRVVIRNLLPLQTVVGKVYRICCVFGSVSEYEVFQDVGENFKFHHMVVSYEFAVQAFAAKHALDGKWISEQYHPLEAELFPEKNVKLIYKELLKLNKMLFQP